MKKVIILFVLLCANIMAWGQMTERGMERLKKAQAGDAEEQYWVSFYYREGKEGYPKNEQESIKWFKKSAENGYAEAQYELGELYHFGNRGFPEDKNEYLKWCLKAANGGYEPAYFSLGLHYKYINKQEAIYWLKKCMDDWYEEYGEEHELASIELRELGVIYHPKRRASTHVSSSSSGSSGSSRTSASSGKSSSECLYSAIYTTSETGYSSMGQPINNIAITEEVKFFDDYIMVGPLYCKYLRTSGNWKIYQGMSGGFGVMSNQDFYYVNSNYEMKKVSETVGPYMMETFTYAMTRGENTYTGGSDRNNYSGHSNGSSNRSGNTRSYSNQNTEHNCGTCKGTKKCIVCKGNKKLHRSLGGKNGDYYIDCSSCNGSGRCTVCNGTGRSTKMYNY